jgi:hypothetical protein
MGRQETPGLDPVECQVGLGRTEKTAHPDARNGVIPRFRSEVADPHVSAEGSRGY